MRAGAALVVAWGVAGRGHVPVEVRDFLAGVLVCVLVQHLHAKGALVRSQSNFKFVYKKRGTQNQTRLLCVCHPKNKIAG